MELGLKYTRHEDGTKSVSIPEDSRAAVIAFIRDNAAKTVAEIEAVIREGHGHIIDAIANVSDAQAQHKPSADDWSILELMAHVVSTQRIIVGLCTSLGEGHWPPGVGAEWEEERAQDGVTIARFASIDEARAASEAAHADLLALIRKLDGVDTTTRFKHFLFGAMNAREWAVFQRIHDFDHTPQLLAIKESYLAARPSA
jgi:hypothetical protein